MKSILLFTHSYPFGKETESFLSSEIEIASLLEIDLTIIPLKSSNYKRDLPQKIKLNSSLAERTWIERSVVFLEMMYSSLFWEIPFQDKFSPKTLKQYFYAIKYLYGAFIIKHFIVKNKNHIPNNSILYSYWFNHTSLGAVLAKMSYPSEFKYKVISRGHGFDVYEDKVGIYFPYRELSLKYIDHVYIVSLKGKLLLESKYPGYRNKISLSRLGTKAIENHRTIEKTDTISFLSCSSIIPIKRVDLIYRSISKYASENLHKNIKWTHIGSGSGLNNLHRLIKRSTLSNFSVELKGYIENDKVKQILANEKFDIFINLSLSEGVPVSIMEAISVGIPILATDVGGNNEIVTSETGLTIPVNFEQKFFNIAVNEIIAAGESLRTCAYHFYKKYYEAKSNYPAFYNNILKD